MRKKIIHCHSFWRKFSGLMFSRWCPDIYYLFYNEKQLHGFFMRYPLYILIADRNYKIIAKFILKPWTVSKYYSQSKYILETTDLCYWQNKSLGDRMILSVPEVLEGTVRRSLREPQ